MEITDLPIGVAEEWSGYRLALLGVEIHLLEEPDRLVWDNNPLQRSVTASLAYDYLIGEKNEQEVNGVGLLIWNDIIPLKISCFICLLLHNKVLTWNILQKHGFRGPGVCRLCKQEGEEINHLFGSCAFFQLVCSFLCDRWKSLSLWDQASLVDNLECYFKQSPEVTFIAFFTLWEVWCVRNWLIFNGDRPDMVLLAARILSRNTATDRAPVRDLIGAPPLPIDYVMYPIGFFGGAAQLGVGGAGMVIKLSDNHFFHLRMGAGRGSNTRSKLLALWGLLWFAENRNIRISHIFGDSLCIINWASGLSVLRPLSLQHWMIKVRILIQRASDPIFTHIRRS